MILLDASAWIEYLRHTGSAVDRAVQALLESGATICTTDSVWADLLAGASSEGEAARLRRLLRSLDLRPGGGPAEAEEAGRLARLCRGRGEPVRALASCRLAAIGMRDGIPILASDLDFQILARHVGVQLVPLPVDGITVPVGFAPPEVEARERATPSPAGGTTIGAEAQELGEPEVVLIVEDDPASARTYERALERPGRSIRIAGTAAQARALIAEAKPGAIVLDLMLPDEDGRAMLPRFRREPATRGTAVVVITGMAGENARMECLGYGADAFLRKPVNHEALAHAVDDLIRPEAVAARLTDPLGTILPLQEFQAAASAIRVARASTAPVTIAFLKIHVPGAETDEARAPELASRIRALAASLGPALQRDEPLGRWTMDQLILLSPRKTVEQVEELVRGLSSELSWGAKSLFARIRTLGASDDLLEMIANLSVRVSRNEAMGGERIDSTEGERDAATRVVLVEDEPVTAALVKHRLERSGFVVTHVADGAAGLEEIRTSFPDVAILDVQLPSMDGFAILGHLKEDPQTRSIPALVFTSLDREEHVNRAFALGAEDYLTKPFSPSELLARVLRLARPR